MTVRSFWLRLLTLWTAAAAVLATAGSRAWSAPQPPLDAALIGVAAGVALFALQSGLRPRVSPATVAVLVVSAGAEEAIWRGFALGALSPVTGWPAALAATSVAFAYAHRRARRRQLLSGLSFGGVYLTTGSLVAAWCCHAAYNLAIAASAGAARGGAP